jgi:transposase-like protein
VTTIIIGGKSMSKCPNCGAENATPRKSWKMAGRPDKMGKRTELTIGLFDCKSCGKTFKVVLNKRKI